MGRDLRRYVALLAGLLYSCAPSLSQHYAALRPSLQRADYPQAAQRIRAAKQRIYGRNSALLYHLDLGMVQTLAGETKHAAAAFEQAKAIAEDLYTEQISAHLQAWASTDNALPYRGEDFERALLHVFAALNYLQAEQLQAAHIEARQVSQLLALHQDNVASQRRYQDDGFCRWLAGKIWAAENSQAGHNGAWIEYAKALAIYSDDYQRHYQLPVPRLLVEDALRSLQALGPSFAQERAALQRRFAGYGLADGPADDLNPSQGSAEKAASPRQREVVVIALLGEAPYKVDRFWTVHAPHGPLRVAYPQFVANPSRVQGVEVAFGQAVARGEIFEDITQLAITNLADHIDQIRSKAIARALSKYAASATAMTLGNHTSRSRQPGQSNAGSDMLYWAGYLANVTHAILEEADKRSWLTLPAQIQVARLWVPEDARVGQLRLYGPNGQLLAVRSLQLPDSAAASVFLLERAL